MTAHLDIGGANARWTAETTVSPLQFETGGDRGIVEACES